MDLKSIEPYRRALVDYINGDTMAKLIIYRDDGYSDDHCLQLYFQNIDRFSPLDKTAVDLCRGYILDVGAGAGRHSLALKAKGCRVCSIDLCPEAVRIMRKRGVADARCIDIFDFHETGFDTILLMMHGIGVVRTLSGLNRFLILARSLIKSDGQILMDSVDLRKTANLMHLAYQEFNRRIGRYVGETQLVFEYKGEKGPPFQWLQVDPDTLAEYALKTGWNCDIPYHESGGDYLARLTLQKASVEGQSRMPQPERHF